jgi:hypothetical protein
MDDFDSAKWTLVAVVTYGLFGFGIGLIMNLIILLLAKINKKATN